MKNLSFFCLFLLASVLHAQGPVVTTWIRNSGTETGYNGLPSNVQLVQYATNNVYISCSCIPGYDIGPWNMNPNTPVNKNFVYKITRNPQQNTGTPTPIGLGHTGVWSNGVSIFNADDGMSYNNQGVWKRNALYWEGLSFDNCLGHPAPGGEYHHHVNPVCLYDAADSTHHAPIIGYAFDGFPVYGAYAQDKADGTGPVRRMRSSYQLRNISTRTTLPNGSPAGSNGPAVGTQFPLGCFLQDYVYVQGSGDLDEHNGRFCKTPEYPNGIYAYFVTIDSALNPIFPYTMYGTYYGVVQPGNTGGPNSGHNTISEPTTVYNGVSATREPAAGILYELGPNPVRSYTYIYLTPESANNVQGFLYDEAGRMLAQYPDMQPSIQYTLDFSAFPYGGYLLELRTENQRVVQKIVKSRR
ncbi:MAG: T9SS type A sorting domain-containing protein [Bacteroidetes bacterium]|nr:T9SS type A sorting domain-containing protein [Bacteroidota bacterium]